MDNMGINNLVSPDKMTKQANTNHSSIHTLIQSFMENFQQFHLPGLPSIGELSDASKNVTVTVQRELEENFDRLPWLKDLSEMSKNVTDDIQSNVKRIEADFSELSRNISSEFKSNLENFHVPNLKELSQFSHNFTKDMQSNFNDLSMFSKNASKNLKYMARNVSDGIEEGIKKVATMPEVITLSEMSRNITSDLGEFIFFEADKLSQYSKNVTETLILPTIEGLSELSKNLTNELGANIEKIKLPDINELVRSVQNFTNIFDLNNPLFHNKTMSIISNRIPDDHSVKEDSSKPINIVDDILPAIISPLASIKSMLEDFKIKSKVSEDSNYVNIDENIVENDSYSDLSATSTIINALKTLQGMIDNIAKNQDKVLMAFKAIPTLMPYILEANTPSLNIFLKEGTEFSIQDLSAIHSALINFHNFVSDTRNSLDENKAPSFHNLTLLIKQRNLGLLNVLLQLMVRADSTKTGSIKLTKEDIYNVEKTIITPKEFYEVMFKSKNIKERYYDRKFTSLSV